MQQRHTLAGGAAKPLVRGLPVWVVCEVAAVRENKVMQIYACAAGVIGFKPRRVCRRSYDALPGVGGEASTARRQLAKRVFCVLLRVCAPC